MTARAADSDTSRSESNKKKSTQHQHGRTNTHASAVVWTDALHPCCGGAPSTTLRDTCAQYDGTVHLPTMLRWTQQARPRNGTYGRFIHARTVRTASPGSLSSISASSSLFGIWALAARPTAKRRFSNSSNALKRRSQIAQSSSYRCNKDFIVLFFNVIFL